MRSIPRNVRAEVSTLPLFKDVSSDLLGLITPEMICTFPAEEAIFHEGDPATHLVILLRGRACIEADGIQVAWRTAYEVIGEQAFINETTRNGTARAQGLTEVLMLPRLVVNQFMRDPTFAGNLLRIVSEKLTQATGERSWHYRNEHLLISEFRAHLSPEVTNRLLADGRTYGEPHFIDAVILFSDIRSFTARSSQLMADDIAAQLSPYLDHVVDIIHHHDGMVDKFIGDAVMAIWGFAPTEGDIAMQAFECAQVMVRAAATQQFAGEPIEIGVGLNAGRVFVGNVGGEGKRQFTVLGTPVNLAARYESASKELAAPIVMGPAFAERLPKGTQALLVVRNDQPIKGADDHLLYTFDPNSSTSEGE